MVEVSVIIPVYNGELYISECLDSIINQDFDNFECIVVNDGSKDRTEEIVNKYLEIDNRIKLITQSNQGVLAARAKGILESTGKYIYFLDADDTIQRDALSAIYNEVDKDTALVVSEYFNVAESVNVAEYVQRLFKYKSWGIMGKLFLKELFDPYVLSLPPHFKVGEDFLTQLRFMKNVGDKKIKLVNIKKYNYREDSSTSVQKKLKKDYQYEKMVIEEVISSTNQLNPNEKLKSNLHSFELSYLGGMMGYKYDINFQDCWIQELAKENKYCNIIEFITIKAIKINILRYIFICEKQAKQILRLILNKIH